MVSKTPEANANPDKKSVCLMLIMGRFDIGTLLLFSNLYWYGLE
jgi:hypothetical protein